MSRFITNLLGLILVLFVYYVIGWFILNEKDAFIWPWWIKLLYVLMCLASWGNLSKSLNSEDN
jgi:hypothetical protein